MINCPICIMSVPTPGICAVCAEARTRLNAAAPSVQPGDWKLVPIEPTEAMIEAAIASQAGKRWDPAEIYRAMLAAAPAPSVAQSEREAFEAKFGNPNGITAAMIAALWEPSTGMYRDDEIETYYGGWKSALAWRASAGSARVDARAAAEEIAIDVRRMFAGVGKHVYLDPGVWAAIIATHTHTHTHSAPPAQEIVDAIQGLLDHACIADAAPEDVDEEDRARERKARALLTRLTS